MDLYEVLVKQYSPLVLSVVGRVVSNREDAEEIVQDTFVKAYFSLRTFQGKSSFSTWIYRIAYNMSMSKLRKKERHLFMDNLVSFIQSNDNDQEIEEKYNIERQFELLDYMLRQLSVKERFLVTLFYQQQSSISDIAEITSESESNVKVKLHRIRKKMISMKESIKTDVNYGL